MDADLPLVVIVGHEPAVAALIQLLLGKDLCRIAYHRDGDSLLDGVENDPPALVLIDVDFLGTDPRGMSRRIKAACPTAPLPLIYVSAADVRTSDDGVPLADCLATTSRPAEFRATIEARLHRTTLQ